MILLAANEPSWKIWIVDVELTFRENSKVTASQWSDKIWHWSKSKQNIIFYSRLFKTYKPLNSAVVLGLPQDRLSSWRKSHYLASHRRLPSFKWPMSGWDLSLAGTVGYIICSINHYSERAQLANIFVVVVLIWLDLISSWNECIKSTGCTIHFDSLSELQRSEKPHGIRGRRSKCMQISMPT